jgi:DNA topoisomerase-1
VDAQQARRVLDRLVGYNLSPLLWSKVRGRLSAGRVQSAALRLVVDREKEIREFVAREYWTIDAELLQASKPPAFRARLVRVDGETPELGVEADVERVVGDLRTAVYKVERVRRGTRQRRPYPPFTTSTLQQAAYLSLHAAPWRWPNSSMRALTWVSVAPPASSPICGRIRRTFRGWPSRKLGM